MIQELLIRFFVSALSLDYSIGGSYFDDGKKIKRIKYFFLDLKNIYKKNSDKFFQKEIYLKKIKDEELYAYNVYQIEGKGKSLFSNIEGDENTIMGLPIKQIKEFLNNL